MFYRLPDVLQTSNIFCGALGCYKFQKFMSVDVNDKRKLQIMNNTSTYHKLHLLNTNSMTIVYFRFLGN